ncbi:hypothetical protein V6N11_077159 [Hibiscus sabdariffa]|uniref:CCHC-type domain-containing protein n=1 Tax=Hibiscus sabdariffa TaxID=183260 RepID=A0ABR2TCC2_9ROSI
MDLDSMPTGENSKPAASYKDVVMGGSESYPDEDLIPIDDDDIDLLDEDFRVGITDGIPFIEFSSRVCDLAVKSFEFTFVLKILGRRVGYTTLYNRLVSIWKPASSIKLIDIENDYFLVKFSSRSDYIAALTDGPWTIFGHYITVESWSSDFDPSQTHPSRIMAWVRLPGLPITWYKRSLIEAIGSCIGSVVNIDYQTDYGRRGRFAHMAAKINLNQPLTSKIIINGRTQIVEYESLPVVCFNCGIYGHTNERCPKNQMHEKSTEMDSNMPDPPKQHPPIDPYGPWMLVENRRRRPMKSPGHFNKSVPHSIATSSRYNPVFIESDSVAGTSKATDATPISDVQQNLSISALNQDNVAPLPGNTIGLDPTHVPAPVSYSGTPKSKAKTQVTSRKSSSLILKPGDSNVMPKRSVSGFVSTAAEWSSPHY